MGNYTNRKWLNPSGHPSTGAIVAYHGESPWSSKDKAELMTLLEISDCHCKIRLHKTDRDTISDFVEKLRLLRNVTDEFIEYLITIQEE